MYILYIHVNTCSIREGHFTCDAVAVNSSVLNDLNYTVVDVIYHSVYTPLSVSSNASNIHVYTLSVLNCLSSLQHWSQSTYIHVHGIKHLLDLSVSQCMNSRMYFVCCLKFSCIVC